MTFEDLCARVDMRKVDGFVAGFRDGKGTHEKDQSDEAFAAMLLGVRQEVVDGGWWFNDQLKMGAECEIHYAMYVDDEKRAERKAIVRDFIETSELTAKQDRKIRDILCGWFEDD